MSYMQMTTKEFEILARTLRPRILKTSRQIVGSDDDAEDIVQDTMLKLWELRDDLGEYRSVEALATIVAKRLSLNFIRRQHPSALDEAVQTADSEPTAEEQMILHQRNSYIDSVLSKLPDSQQSLLRMRHIEGYDNAEIARVLGSNEGAVRTALCRARRRVAELFDIEVIQ